MPNIGPSTDDDALTPTDEKQTRGRRGEGSMYWDDARKRWHIALVVSKPGEEIKRVSGTAKTEKEAFAVLRRLKTEADTHSRVVKQKTLSVWLAEHIDQADIKPSTRHSYRSMQKNYVDKSIGKNRIDPTKKNLPGLQRTLAAQAKPAHVDLVELIGMLANLEVIVLLGKQAQIAWRKAGANAPCVLECQHPSPLAWNKTDPTTGLRNSELTIAAFRKVASIVG